ncbi:MAG TPA: hypothetical protein VN699_10955 [Pirellulales bacterium]|nr:hypothetical protein [Pirellulales bacterium]
MDSFRLCVALGPLAVYLLLLGVINLSRRPLMVTGGRDLAALGIGVSGLVLIGPVELLLPEEAVNAYQKYVWLLLVAMYSLGVSLAALLSRPRLTIYNMSVEQLRPVLAAAINGLDNEARWAGSSLVLPGLHVELHLEPNSVMRNVSLVASGDEQSYAGWRQLDSALSARLKPAESPPNPWGVALAIAAALMIGVLGWQMLEHPQAISQGFRDMLRL